MVIPKGVAVRINLRSEDVIHSFWVPKLAGKVDLMPGRKNHMWLQASETGHYYGQCAEFCGDSHASGCSGRRLPLSPSPPAPRPTRARPSSPPRAA
ncbi:MAG: hypothetical protein CAK86_00365 [Opitutia bacterium AMD-G1]|nr:MAG: hypothetical protein CAK86_00365 [Opitutae bacterium AMD-G1]